MIYIILIAGVLNFFLGILSIQNSKRNKSLIAFSVFCFLTSVWVLLNFFVYFYEIVSLVRFTYALGPFVISSLLAWSYFYNPRKKHFLLPVIIYFVGFVFMIFSSFPGIVIGDIISISFSGIVANEGKYFDIWGLYTLVVYLTALLNVILIYRKSQDEERKQVRQIILGLVGFGGITMFVSIVLPAFGIMQYTNLDSPSSLIFALLTFIAIVKYRFLGVKVIIAQVLVFLLISISAVDIFYAISVIEILLRIAFFLTTLLTGMILIRSVVSEVKRKEELQKMTEKLALANEELKRLDNAKSEFISIASHQLRTPLTAIKGFVSLVLEGSYGEINPSVRDALTKVYGSGERLIHLVEDLLNVSRIESGRMEFGMEKTKMELILHELYDTFILVAKGKKLSLDLKLPKRPLTQVSVDNAKIREVLSNLIDNALKYTPKGGVVIKAEMAISDGKTNKARESAIAAQSKVDLKGKKVLRVVVSDTGIGIPADEMPYLFGKFSRGKDTSRLHVGGTGLGLYVGKSIVEAHGGHIWAESEGENKGSRFIVELPLSAEKTNRNKK